MALLALVASAGTRGVSRERVAGVLWGEAGEENARHSLSQNLYTLRRETGCDWIPPAPKLILNGSATSDVADFLAAQAVGDFERVAALYTGPFLLDFYLPGSAEFEHWVDEERSLHRNDGDVSGADDGGCVAVWTGVVELELHCGVRRSC